MQLFWSIELAIVTFSEPGSSFTNCLLQAIKKGIAKEQARKVLPEGITKTTLYMNGTIRSWIHYVELRGANGTQQEHMDIAHACADAIAKIFPNIEAYANGNS